MDVKMFVTYVRASVTKNVECIKLGRARSYQLQGERAVSFELWALR